MLSALKAADTAMAAADDARGNNVLLREGSGDTTIATPVPPTPALQGADAPLNPFFKAPSLTLQEGRSLLSSPSDEVCRAVLCTCRGCWLLVAAAAVVAVAIRDVLFSTTTTECL